MLSLALAAIAGQTVRAELVVLKSFGYADQSGETPSSSLLEVDDGIFFGTCRDGGLYKGGTIFRINRDGTSYQTLHHFIRGDEGGHPLASLVKGSDGLLYGTAGGESGEGGAIFRLDRDGGHFSLLHRFPHNPLYQPTTILEGRDRMLYGITFYGGTSDRGTAYRLNKSGDGYQVLHNFTSSSGEHPRGLIEGSDGLLYGTSVWGGAFDMGVIFSFQKDGSGYRVIYDMGATANDGVHPGFIFEASDGILYGTSGWGLFHQGTVFRIGKDGSGYQVLHHFGSRPDDGSSPQGMTEGKDGKLYGHTDLGGVNGRGIVFSVEKNGGNYTVIRDFIPGEGSGKFSPLIQGSDGLLYGTGAVGGADVTGDNFGTIYSLRTDGSNLVVLRRFHPAGYDGTQPVAPLAEGTDGALYGTTSGGGASGLGTVFKLNKDGGNYRILHSFLDAVEQGYGPSAALIEGADHRLYGTTLQGGRDYNWGTVFSLMKDGTGFSVLHHFTPRSTGDAGEPRELVEGADGRLYGTTGMGGSSSGTIFSVGKDGSNYSVVHDFAEIEGPPPKSLIKATDGWLYGLTSGGGASDLGSIYRVNLDGSAYSVVYSFSGGQHDGARPLDLLQGRDGKLYVTTISGGQYDGGVVLKMNPDGSDFLLLHNFPVNGTQRSLPTHLTEGVDGVLYGTTAFGGKENRGSIYALYKDGSRYCTLYSFRGGSNDGADPLGVIQCGEGALYGTTYLGGHMDYGIVFRFVVRPELNLTVRGGVTEIRATGISDTLAIEASSDLATWTEIASGQPANGELTVEEVTSVVPRFYRAAAK
jgi:uncharacterized repeat protein (TIGR03803 family)